MKNFQDTDLDATYYQDHSQPQYTRAQELLRSLKLTESSSVLDVGCGYGNIIAEIAQKSSKGRLVGIDASHSMIELAKESFPTSKFPNLEFYESKAEEISFADDSFDAVICFSCLLWVREPKKALELMCRSLKPGGSLLIMTYLKESGYITFLEKALEEYPEYKELSAPRTMLSIEEYKEILQSNGMELDEFRSEWRHSKYKDSEDLKAYIKGWLSCYVPLPADMQDPFLDKAVAFTHLVDASPCKKEIALPYQLLAIRARKQTS